MFYKPFLIVIVGPSGVGKTTIVREIIHSDSGIKYSISATTRKRRKDEVDGRDYYFLNTKTFKKWIREKKLYEWALVYGDYYGTLKEPVLQWLNAGFKVIMDLDIQGARAIKSLHPNCVSIFVLPPTIEELKKRLMHRGQDKMDAILRRVELARDEINCFKEFNYVVVNEEIDSVAGDVRTIIQAEELKSERYLIKKEASNQV
jgi:guanylate kinase